MLIYLSNNIIRDGQIMTFQFDVTWRGFEGHINVGAITEK